TAALEPVRRLLCIGDKTVQTRAEKGAELGFRRIVVVEKVLLDGFGKKTLRQVGGVGVRFMPFEADVFVGRFPVSGDDRFERALPLCRVVTARRDNRRPPSSRKSVSAQRET